MYISGTKYQYLLSYEMVVPPGLVLLNPFHHNNFITTVMISVVQTESFCSSLYLRLMCVL